MRIAPMDVNELDAEGVALFKAISGPRGGRIDGPFQVWLRANPQLAACINEVGMTLRSAGRLDKRLLEIAVLTVARCWDTRYQWTAHVPIAIDLGVAQHVIDAIGSGERPGFAPEDELAVYDLTVNLLERHAVADALYERLISLIGFDDMVELITAIGQYSLAAIVSNAFEVAPPEGPPLPARKM